MAKGKFALFTKGSGAGKGITKQSKPPVGDIESEEDTGMEGGKPFGSKRKGKSRPKFSGKGGGR